jgi:hypothetical protein
MQWIQILTFIALVAMALFALLSWNEARVQRKDAEIPVISFRFRVIKVEPSDPIYNTEFKRFKKKDTTGLQEGEPVPVFSYRLVNVGAGPAMNVSLKIEKMGDMQEVTPDIDDIIGAKVSPELEVCFATGPINDTNYLRESDTRLAVKYEDIFGRKYKTEFAEKRNRFYRIKKCTTSCNF